MEAEQPVPRFKRQRGDDDGTSSGGSEGERPQLLDAEREPPGGAEADADTDQRRLRRRLSANAAASPAEHNAAGDAGGGSGSGSQRWAAQGVSGAAGAGGGPTAAAGAGASDQPGGSGSDRGNGGSGLGRAGAAGGGIGSDDPASFPELLLLSCSSKKITGSRALKRMFPTVVHTMREEGAESATVQLFRKVGGEEQSYDLKLRRGAQGDLCLGAGGMQLRNDLGLKDGDTLRVAVLPSGRNVIIAANGAAAAGYCSRVCLTASDISSAAGPFQAPLFQMQGLLGPHIASQPEKRFKVQLDPPAAAAAAKEDSDLQGAELYSSEFTNRALTWRVSKLAPWLERQGAVPGDFVRLWVVQQQPQQREEGQEQPLVIYFRHERAAENNGPDGTATTAAGAGGGAAAAGDSAAGQPPPQQQQRQQGQQQPTSQSAGPSGVGMLPPPPPQPQLQPSMAPVKVEPAGPLCPTGGAGMTATTGALGPQLLAPIPRQPQQQQQQPQQQEVEQQQQEVEQQQQEVEQQQQEVEQQQQPQQQQVPQHLLPSASAGEVPAAAATSLEHQEGVVGLLGDLASLLTCPNELGYDDVEVAVGVRRFRCHRLILSARCLYFRRLFTGGSADSGARQVVLQDADPDAFELLLRYMYTGDMTFPPHLMRAVAELANKLLLPKVVHHVHRRLLAAAQPAGVVADMLWAHQQGFQELLGGLKDWYLRHQAEVLAAAEDSVRQLSVAAPSLMYDLHCATVRQADRRHPSGAHRDYVAATVAAITTTSAPILAGNRAPAGTPARASADAVHRREAREREWRRERRRPGWQREARRRLAVAAGWCSAVLFGREEEAEGEGEEEERRQVWAGWGWRVAP
ncbi:hypothetical protein PLESTF_001318400 [Pleodorina starrii]|nr:hypothetical protein PLESTM_001007200 [Pleodorina starrii]GLC73000.1 hypothetical protein PLESTF_001318400 [Pleodorina starrii]